MTGLLAPLALLALALVMFRRALAAASIGPQIVGVDLEPEPLQAFG